MKVSKLSLIAAAILVMSFASCTKERELTDNHNDGVETSMRLAITFPSNGTRATFDPNSTEEEAAITTVDVFIYKANGNFSSRTRLTASDFEAPAQGSNSDKYVAKNKVRTTTGTKNVYVAINLPDAIAVSLIGEQEKALSQYSKTFSIADLTTDNKFVMFSTNPVTGTFVEDENDPANQITVLCERLVAKITVETSPTLDVSAVPGTIKKLEFAINNFNSKLFLLQGAAGDYKDPNWSLTSYDANDFILASSANYAPIRENGDANYSANKNLYTPRYAAENTSEGKRQKEITRVTVRAQIIPTVITNWKNGTDDSEGFTSTDAHGITSPVDFYVVSGSDLEGSFYFTNVNAASDFANAKSLTPIKYTNGLCYWDIFLNKNPQAPQTMGNRWDVLRNDFYMCRINSITGIGRETPDIPDENKEETPDADTKILVDIDVLFWHTPVLSDYDLR